MGALFGFTGPAEPQLLQRMSAALRHRGARLDAHSSPFATLAAQAAPSSPFAISTGTVVRDGINLALAGYVTGTSTGCRSLDDVLARYQARGPQFVEELRGAWVLAVSEGGRLLLARDGVGVRTLYFGRHAGRLLFAVEPKGVLAAPGFPRRIRPAALAGYFAMSFVPGRGTMLQDLDELPAGHRAELQNDGSLALKRWFVFEEVSAGAPCSDEEWVARFRALFGRAVEERRSRGEPLAVFLSGGLDSSAVASEVATRHDGPVHSYALHFGEQYASELPFAKVAAEAAGTTHHEVKLEPKDFLPQLRRIVWHLDEPIGDPITAPNFALASHVAPTTRWVWNGEGGDPVFGGPKNLPMLLHHWYGGIERDPLFRARAYLRSFRRGYEELPRLLDPVWSNAAGCERELEQSVAQLLDGRAPGCFLNKLCAANIRLKAGHLILPKVDRMLGAFGLVALSPFFDERLVRLSFEMPPTLKLARGVDKVIVKRAFAGRIPEQIIARPKSGMRVPVQFWFKGELKKYARHILCRKEVDRVGIFDGRRVERLLAYEAEEADSRHGLLLWMLLTFELWRRVVVEREAL